MSTQIVTITSGPQFQVSMLTQEDQDKNLIQSILALDCTNTWDIVDRQENLAMVHYREGCDLQRYGHLRGVVVDLTKQVVVASSYGHIPIVVADYLTPHNNYLHLLDTDGYAYSWAIEDLVIFQEFRGVAMRVIWYEGRCYHLTHRKIKSENSFWGPNKKVSKTFHQMYMDAGGPQPEQLFDCSRPYSSTCYEFVVVDPSLITGTRQHVETPYIVFVGKQELSLNCAPEEIASGFSTFDSVSEIGAKVSTPCIYRPSQLTFDQANAHLYHGFYPHLTQALDPRQRTGESLVIHHYTQGKVDKIVKIHSIGYDWRYNMCGNRTTLMQQFYSLFNLVYPELRTDADYHRLYSYLPVVSLYTEESLQYLYNTRGGLFFLPSEQGRDSLLKRKDRIRLLWCNYVLALPIHLQPEGIKLFQQYQEDQASLLNWICSVGRGDIIMRKKQTTAPRVHSIYRSAYQSAAQKVASISTLSSEDHRLLHETARYNIVNMLGKEHGPSLHAMVRDMHNYRRK